MKFKPTLNKLVIKVVANSETVKINGLFLPGEENKYGKNIKEGVVLAVGSGYYQNGIFIGVNIDVGDKVLFTAMAGIKTTIEGIDCTIIPEPEVIGIL